MLGSRLGSVTIRKLDLRLVKLTKWPGGYLDFRPGGLEVVSGAIPAVLVQYVDTLELSGVKITMPKDPRLSWSTMVKMHSHTVKSARLDGIQVGGVVGGPGSRVGTGAGPRGGQGRGGRLAGGGGWGIHKITRLFTAIYCCWCIPHVSHRSEVYLSMQLRSLEGWQPTTLLPVAGVTVVRAVLEP